MKIKKTLRKWRVRERGIWLGGLVILIALGAVAAGAKGSDIRLDNSWVSTDDPGPTGELSIDEFLDFLTRTSDYRIEVKGRWPKTRRFRHIRPSLRLDARIRFALIRAGVVGYVLVHDSKAKTIELIILESSSNKTANRWELLTPERNERQLGGVTISELEALKSGDFLAIEPSPYSFEQLGGVTLAQLEALKSESQALNSEPSRSFEQLGGVTAAELEALKRKHYPADPESALPSEQLGGVTTAELEALKSNQYQHAGDSESALPSEQLGGVTTAELEALKKENTEKIAAQ